MTAVAWHLLRGLGAATLIVVALHPPADLSWVTLPLLPLAALLLRGCPMCWLVGLIETASQQARTRPLPPIDAGDARP